MAVNSVYKFEDVWKDKTTNIYLKHHNIKDERALVTSVSLDDIIKHK